MIKSIPNGVYPTMITPYTADNKIDYNAVEQLIDWYVKKGVDGIFAICQSSEIFFLSFEERLELLKFIVERAPKNISIVASGHTADDIGTQIEEAKAFVDVGIDGYVFISNRLAKQDEDDSVFLRNVDIFMDEIKDIAFGIYECPYPYKRLLTPRIIDWCISTGRFRFIKDTCCDPDMLTARMEQLKGTDILLFNANAQTLLHSLRDGAAGYSGIMANFQPDLLAWVCDNFEKQPKKVEEIFNVLSMMAFTEALAYPCTAKYYLDQVGVSMTTESRSRDPKQLTNYHKLVVRQMVDLDRKLKELIQEGN